MASVGDKFERLTIVQDVGSGYVLCVCECGIRKKIARRNLVVGSTKSCGCLRDSRRLKHGSSKHDIYRVWIAMKSRCNNPNDRSYHNYGGRGIKLCERWESSFSNFLADMGNRPKGYDIDRIDNNRGYSPDNCRWVTRRQNLHNTRHTRMLTFNGETLPMRIWAERLGVSHSCLKNRMDRGWSVEVALTANRHERGGKKTKKLKATP